MTATKKQNKTRTIYFFRFTALSLTPLPLIIHCQAHLTTIALLNLRELADKQVKHAHSAKVESYLCIHSDSDSDSAQIILVRPYPILHYSHKCSDKSNYF